MRERSDADGNAEPPSPQKAGPKTKTKTDARKPSSAPRKNNGKGKKVETSSPLNVRRSGRKRYSRKLDDEDEELEEDKGEGEESDDEYKDEDVPDADAELDTGTRQSCADGNDRQ